MQKKNNPTCPFCKMEFSSTFNKNRHIKTKHPDLNSSSTSDHSTRTSRIMCPICTNKTIFLFHSDLIKHLHDVHNTTIKESVLHFRNLKEFTAWRAMENREVDYTTRAMTKYRNGKIKRIYDCIRSDSKGFVSSAKQRNTKAGGTIRINGTCPSRIVANFSADGSAAVNFVETHVGHDDDPRTKRLSKAEQTTIVEQLIAGVSNDRIIEDSRKTLNNKLQRINLVSKGDLANIMRKFNIEKRMNADDMIACNKCKICLHSPENAVKKVTCVCNTRGVALPKQRSKSDIDPLSLEEEDCNVLCIDESSTSQDDVNHFIREIRPRTNPATFEDKREIILQEMNSYARNLDEESFNKYVLTFCKFKTETERENAKENSKKRKIEEQTFASIIEVNNRTLQNLRPKQNNKTLRKIRKKKN